MNMTEEALDQLKPSQKTKQDTPPISVCGLACDQFMTEQIHVNGKSYFVKYDEKTFEQLETFEHEGVYYAPLTGEEIALGVVQLPSGYTDYGSIPELVAEIKTFIHKYLDVSDDYEQFASWYIILTWVYDKFTTINYLSALGDTGTGKTRHNAIIGGLCYRATKGSGAVTVAALKRIHKKWAGTLIIDEGDFREGDETSELIKFFNLGFEKDSPMMNCNKDDPNLLEFYMPYGPKIISRRRQFNDKALEARCLTEVMRQTSRKDLPFILPAAFYTEQQTLRNKLLKYRLLNYKKVNITDSTLDLGEVEPRLKQATYAFASLFSDDPTAFAQFKDYLTKYQGELVEERANSLEGNIINTLVDLVIEGKDAITASMVFDIVVQTVPKTSSRSIGAHLKQLGLQSSVRKITGKASRCIDLDFGRLIQLCQRYTSDPEKVTTLQQLQPLRPPVKSNKEGNEAPPTGPTGTRNHCNLCNFVTGQTTLPDQKTKETSIEKLVLSNVIQTLDIVNDHAGAPIEACLDLMVKNKLLSFTRPDAEAYLDGLKSRGLIFEPKPGYLKKL